MKLKAIEKICKQEKTVMLFNYKGEQWAGDGKGMYLLEGAPKLDKNNILTVFDVPHEKRAEWVTVECEAPDGLNFESDEPGEVLFEEMSVGLNYLEAEMIVGITPFGAMFLDKRYLAPIVQNQYTRIYIRETGGKHYFAVKSGFLLTAVITPVMFPKNVLVNELGAVVDWANREEAKNPQTTFDDLMEEAYAKETMERVYG